MPLLVTRAITLYRIFCSAVKNSRCGGGGFYTVNPLDSWHLRHPSPNPDSTASKTSRSPRFSLPLPLLLSYSLITIAPSTTSLARLPFPSSPSSSFFSPLLLFSAHSFWLILPPSPSPPCLAPGSIDPGTALTRSLPFPPSTPAPRSPKNLRDGLVSPHSLCPLRTLDLLSYCPAIIRQTCRVPSRLTFWPDPRREREKSHTTLSSPPPDLGAVPRRRNRKHLHCNSQYPHCFVGVKTSSP